MFIIIQYKKWAAYLFQTHLVGGLIEMGGGGGGLFHLTKTMVSVLHKELEYKVQKLKYKKLEVMQPRIKNKFELPVGKYTILDQSTQSFTVVIDLVYHLLVKNNKREGRGA